MVSVVHTDINGYNCLLSFFWTETYYAHGILLTLPVIPSENIWWFAADNPTMDTGTEWYRCNIRKYFWKARIPSRSGYSGIPLVKTDKPSFLYSKEWFFICDWWHIKLSKLIQCRAIEDIDHKGHMKCLISAVRKSVATKRKPFKMPGTIPKVCRVHWGENQNSSQINLTMCPIDFSHFSSYGKTKQLWAPSLG